jgi:hypothetical protein
MSKPTHRICVEEPMSIAARRTKPGEEVKPRLIKVGAGWRAKGDTLQIQLELMPPFCFWAPTLKLVAFLNTPDEAEADGTEGAALDDDLPY